LSVGLDGVMLRWLWRRRVIPFKDLREVSSDKQVIRLCSRSGEEARLSAYWTAGSWEDGQLKSLVGFGSRKGYLDAILARIEEARSAREAVGEASAAARLDRRRRQLKDWLRELRGLMTSGQGSFRQETLESEQLWSTLEDVRQPVLVRAAAAVALAPSLDAEGCERLRVASSVVVDPGLRMALNASLLQDEEALLRAFEVMEQEGLSGTG
ncbi:MAG: hypothetical protein RMJ98_21550, partial [Myxococcales bacterium]|nr:hypothetical protein [Polyangiaceae bacterium]MDW8251890.1 hypothetical protein [Myxococcales bacterium]